MTIIYHNPRCSKSRQCFTILENKEENIEVINYMKTPFTKAKLKEVIGLLGMEPIELVRTQEAIWKEKFKGKELSNAEVIQAMLDNPRLIERPIVIKDGKAIVARPPESVLELLK